MPGLVAACRIFICGEWASSLTRDRILGSCIRSLESYPLDHQGSSYCAYLITIIFLHVSWAQPCISKYLVQCQAGVQCISVKWMIKHHKHIKLPGKKSTGWQHEEIGFLGAVTWNWGNGNCYLLSWSPEDGWGQFHWLALNESQAFLFVAGLFKSVGTRTMNVGKGTRNVSLF